MTQKQIQQKRVAPDADIDQETKVLIQNLDLDTVCDQLDLWLEYECAPGKVPQRLLKTVGAVIQKQRLERKGGPKITMVECPRCGAMVTKTQARRGHGCARRSRGKSAR